MAFKAILFRKHVINPSDYEKQTKLSSISNTNKSKKQLKLEKLVKPKMVNNKLMFEESSCYNTQINQELTVLARAVIKSVEGKEKAEVMRVELEFLRDEQANMWLINARKCEL